MHWAKLGAGSFIVAHGIPCGYLLRSRGYIACHCMMLMYVGGLMWCCEIFSNGTAMFLREEYKTWVNWQDLWPPLHKPQSSLMMYIDGVSICLYHIYPLSGIVCESSKNGRQISFNILTLEGASKICIYEYCYNTSMELINMHVLSSP